VSELTPAQERRRAAVESFIKLTEPGLNLILAAGDRISRLAEPEDHEYYPARPFAELEPSSAPSGGQRGKRRAGAKTATRPATRSAPKPKPASRRSPKQGTQ
jgi:hypothetical protein